LTEEELAERIFEIERPRLIEYSRLRQHLGLMGSLMRRPAHDRMPCLVLVANPGNGKSTVLSRHASLHKPDPGVDENAATYPVIVLKSPGANERAFYEKILRALNAPKPPYQRVEAMAEQVVIVLKTARTRMLIIDEFHDILESPGKKPAHFLTAIKELHNELPISIVGAGTRAVYQALKSDRQLESRFRPIELPDWQLDEELIALLESFKATWGIEFDSEALGPKILAKAGNTIGEISWLLENAAKECARRNKYQVTSGLLDNCGYVRRI